MKAIPLNNGYAFQRFRVNLGNNLLVFKLSWLTRYGYFCVDIFNGDTPVTLGRALHPDVNLLSGLNNPLGRLVLDGEPPTISTLGVNNRLIWYPRDE